MKENELKNYQKLTKFQKEVVDALLNIGFTYKYQQTWEMYGFGEINVSKFNCWGDLLKKVHQLGKDEKRYEFLYTLGLI